MTFKEQIFVAAIQGLSSRDFSSQENEALAFRATEITKSAVQKFCEIFGHDNAPPYAGSRMLICCRCGTETTTK